MDNAYNGGLLKEHVWSAALAGLLHDVGKVEQRARETPHIPAPDVLRDGQPIHATWSVYFAEQFVPEPYRNAARLGAYHHAPDKAPMGDKHLCELVALADKLSAGELADLEKGAPGGRPPNQLVTIFDRVAVYPNISRAVNYLPLLPLSLNRSTLFPAVPEGRGASDNAYKELRDQLEHAARGNIADPQTYIENLLAATQRLTWCVPSAYYNSIPDVSLYDHARMTAALAVCLADWDHTAVRELLDAVERDFHGEPHAADDGLMNQEVALLIGGDISGVQDFIYTVTSKFAAKTLRGRSFYLQLLGEAVLRFILRELGLPYTNVIYSGGGNFFLLAPMRAAERLPAIQQYVTETLLTHHGCALYLALGTTEVSARGFRHGAFKTHWDAMHLAMGAAKQRRYTELDEELYAHVFEPVTHGGNQEQTCSVCGEESEEALLLEEGAASNDKVCPLCKSFWELGAHLTQADFVALGFSPSQETKKHDAASALRAFGMQVAFGQPHRQTIDFEVKPERAVVWAPDNAKNFPPVGDVPTARLTRYTVNRVPQIAFDELQEESEGINRLGVLRMDVDNLGELFGKGFGEGEKNSATLSRIAALSFQMGLFFEGWVKKLCADTSPLIYAVYAGGDDVFLIAPWSIVPELAEKIAADLDAYSGKNPDVHLSAGMTFIHGKYPVYQAAEDAKDALDQAKGIDNKKNAFSVFAQAWKWEDFAKVHAKFNRLKTLVGDPHKVEGGLGGPQAILQTLRQLALDESEKAKQVRGKPVWGRWMWTGAYKLTRDAERERSRNPEVAKQLLAIHEGLGANEYREIGQWGAAARWAQLWLREKQDASKR